MVTSCDGIVVVVVDPAVVVEVTIPDPGVVELAETLRSFHYTTMPMQTISRGHCNRSQL